MALHPQSTFSTGELDPVLGERTTLDKFRAGLKTARNIVVGRAGNSVSRPGRSNLRECKLDNSPVVIFTIPRTGVYTEWGVGYVRIYYNAFSTLFVDLVTGYTSTDLLTMNFEYSGKYVYVFVGGKGTRKLDWTIGAFVVSPFATPSAPVAITNTLSAPVPAGYFVDYVATYVSDGQESAPSPIFSGATVKIPIANGQANNLVLNLGPSVNFIANVVTEVRFYRRPANGGVFGYLGTTNALSLSGPNLVGSFIDLGAASDYTHQPPDSVAKITHPLGIQDLQSRTGIIYQQSLLLSDWLDREAIYKSRTGYQNNFNREYPLSSDSALNFKAASSGTAEILRFLDSYGLIAFTTQGIFINTGPLSPTNLALERKGKWIIDVNVNPLAVPGGVLFIDSATNTVRSLNWSTEMGGYDAEDVGVYSGHFFRYRKVKSWAFQEGLLPVLWVTFDDGQFASFTYEYAQNMRAWTRHDSLMIDGEDSEASNLFIEQVSETGIPDNTLFLVRKGTKRYVEISIPRYVPASYQATDPVWWLNASIAAMDSTVTMRRGFAGGFKIVPTVVDEWDGPLSITCENGEGFFLAAGMGAVNSVLRVFDLVTRAKFDLKVTQRIDNNQVIVTCDQEFPEDLSLFTVIFWCNNVITGLAHLEGEYVGVIVDGRVVASPLNDVDNLPFIQVVGGQITLPDGDYGAVVHVGRVYAMDVGTLDIDTNEQKPTLIESQTVNKLYMKVFESRGLFVASKFPDNNSVAGMEPIDRYPIDYTEAVPFLGNRFKPALSVRHEITLPGDWQSNGRMAVRQVDPVHFEILSIIPDVEVHARSGG